MARDVIDPTPIETRDDLVAWFEGGIKPKSRFLIGTEHEKFTFTFKDHAPVPYEGHHGIRSLLEGMQMLLGWEPIMEGPNVIGLFDVTHGGAISLEPGGQFELSGAPLATVHQTWAELTAHLVQLREVANPLGIGFLGLGMTPTWTRAQVPMMPKGRYRIMTNYMPKVGNLGLDMMYRTCTVQVNLDFSLGSRHGQEAARVAGAAAGRDRLVRQFAVHRRQAERLPVVPLGNLARHRCRPRRHAAVDVRAGNGVRALGRLCARRADVFRQARRHLYRRRRPVVPRSAGGQARRSLPGERATISDWANHSSTIFPEVRLKRYLEMRGADGGPWRRLPALPAFWVGILYDDAGLDAAWDLVKDWTALERQKLRDEVPRLGFAASIRGRSLRELAAECLILADAGLKRRKRLNSRGEDETRFLAPLVEIVERGKTPAEILLDQFHGPWNGNIDRVFDEYAY